MIHITKKFSEKIAEDSNAFKVHLKAPFSKKTSKNGALKGALNCALKGLL